MLKQAIKGLTCSENHKQVVAGAVRQGEVVERDRYSEADGPSKYPEAV